MITFNRRWYAVEQGMYSPRDGTIGYRAWEFFPTLPEAKAEAKRLKIARVLAVEIVAVYPKEKP